MRAALLAIFVCSAITATSQIVFDDGKPPAKQRSPELEALNWLVGRWNSEFVVRETRESKEFKSKGNSVEQWSPNGQFLISDEWSLLPGYGAMPNFWANRVEITTWDPIKKDYRITDVTAGSATTSVMTMSGKSGIIRSEEQKGGHVTKTTMTFERVSDTEMRIRTETSVDDGPKWISMEGTAKKIPD